MSAIPTTGTVPAETKKRARDPQDSDAAWSLEPHVCRVCFGRIASRQAAGGGRLYQCSNCGIEAQGAKASVVCACGMKLRKHKGDGRSGVVLADAGMRCHANAAVSPEFPSLFVASYAGAQSVETDL